MIIAIISCLLLIYVVYWFSREKCKHTKFFESRSCTAYCYHCNTNLGFIGDVRKDLSKEEIWLNQPFDKL